jgi:hypothetical protein
MRRYYSNIQISQNFCPSAYVRLEGFRRAAGSRRLTLSTRLIVNPPPVGKRAEEVALPIAGTARADHRSQMIPSINITELAPN